MKPSGSRTYWFTTDDVAIEIPPGEAVVGRDSTCAIAFAEDRSLSRRHAKIRRVSEGIILEDLDSANGTWVDGERVTGPVLLAGGESVRLGSKELRLESGLTSPRSRVTTRQDVPKLRRSAPTPDDLLDTTTRREEAFFEGERTTASEEGGATLSPEVLKSLLAAVRSGPAERRPSRRLIRSAAKSALRLAEAGSDEKWLSLALQIYADSGFPMPTSVIEPLLPLLWKVRGVDPQLIVRCVRAIERHRGEPDAAGNASLARLRAQAMALGGRFG